MDDPNALYQLDGELTRDQLIDALDGIPGRLRHLLQSRGADSLLRRAGPEEWSPMECVRHIRDAVQVYGMRFKWMILDEQPFLPNYDENRWAADSPDGPGDAPNILDEVASYRGETVRLLRGLRPEDWSRQGRHEVTGPIELEAYVRHELVHEELHLDQLSRALDGA